MLTRRRIMQGAGLVAAGLLAAAWGFRPKPYHTIRSADQITLYEGLPHPMYEEAAYQQESKGGSAIEIAGFLFYREPLELTAADAPALRNILGDRRTYDAYTDGKRCGGFHPDYAVEWSAGVGSDRLLICFGCFEVRLQAADGSIRAYDLKRDGARYADSRLLALLGRYRKNRPYNEWFGPLAGRPEVSPPGR